MQMNLLLFALTVVWQNNCESRTQPQEQTQSASLSSGDKRGTLPPATAGRPRERARFIPRDGNAKGACLAASMIDSLLLHDRFFPSFH